MAAQWPLVVNRLVVLLPTLAGWSDVVIFDGPPVTDDAPLKVCTVGFVETPDGVGDPAAGSYSQTVPDIDAMLQETGTVRSQLTCWSGDETQSTVRASTFALADALEAAVRADPRLGVLPSAGRCEFSADVLAISNKAGVACSLVLTLSYICLT